MKQLLKLYHWYRRLGMVPKIGLWGSICSIISLTALIFPQASVSDNQTSYGANSLNINSSGDVRINYNSSQESSAPYNFLQHPDGGENILIASPSLTNPKIVCNPESGTKVRFLQEKRESPLMVWIKVEVVSGTCKGKIGWVGKSVYHASH